jgi:hypothetical protein
MALKRSEDDEMPLTKIALEPETGAVLCDGRCPEWGRLREGVVAVRCNCGTVINVCVACFEARRRTDCGCFAGRKIVKAAKAANAAKMV